MGSPGNGGEVVFSFLIWISREIESQQCGFYLMNADRKSNIRGTEHFFLPLTESESNSPQQHDQITSEEEEDVSSLT